MELTGLSRRDRRRLAEALRRREPVRLRLDHPPPSEVRLDEFVPLCHQVASRDPRWRMALEALLPPAARPGHPARVTAVIPSNRHPPLSVDALLGQDIPVRVLVLSNGDGPDKVPGAEVVRVPWQGHGPTRQAAVERVDDPYLLFLVDDAVPLGAGFVRTLVEALETGSWDAVFARQIPWPDADPITRERLRRWTPAGDRVVEAPQLDHVAALHRTATLRTDPLPDVPIAEDAVWSLTHRIGYVPYAPVLHSHPRKARDLYRRNRDIHAQLVASGQDPTVSGLVDVVAALPSILRPVLRGGPAEVKNQLAELLGQWRGGKKGRRSRERARPPPKPEV